MRKIVLLLFVLLMIGGVTVNFAKVGSVELTELIKGSENILIGKVLEIKELSNIKIAVVEVETNLKGNLGGRAYYCASSTWACDVSKAKLDERAVFFLIKRQFNDDQSRGAGCVKNADDQALEQEIKTLSSGSPLFFLAHAGRGRLPINTRNEIDFVSVPPGIILPHNLKYIDLTKRKSAQYIAAIQSPDLVDFIHQTINP